MSRPYRLRIPGPTTVPERVRIALASPVVNHRGPEFAEVMRDIETGLREIMGTANAVMLFSCSGTGMMEASLINTLSPEDHLLVINNGQFAGRFVQIAEALGVQVDSLDVIWGEAVEPEVLRARLSANNYRAVVAVHNESSTGVVADLAAIGAVVRETDTILIVDSVSGLAGIEMRQDEWGVDVLLSASQKALMCPPGIGIASVSEKAWRVIESHKQRPSLYFDFQRARQTNMDGQTPFTPAVSLEFGLREALRIIEEEGLDNVLARHARLAGALQAGGQALGLEIFTRSPIRSNTVTVFKVPADRDGGDVVKHLYARYATVIAGARNQLRGTVIRFGTMGCIEESDVLLDLHYLERTLEDLAWPVPHGSAVTAASEYLKQG